LQDFNKLTQFEGHGQACSRQCHANLDSRRRSLDSISPNCLYRSELGSDRCAANGRCQRCEIFSSSLKLAEVEQTVGDAGYIQAYNPPNLSTEVGLENLFIDIRPDETGLPINVPAAKGVAVGYSGWTEDSWMRNVVCQGFVNDIEVNRTVSRITMADMSFRRRSPVDNAAGYGTDVGLSGTQILLVNSETLNTNSSYAFSPATQAEVGGPNVILFHKSEGLVVFQPHQRVGLSSLPSSSSKTL
jgi:hypothetical protein